MKSEEYKKRLENLGVKDIGKAVDDLFSSMGYVGRLLFWYWHFKEHEMHHNESHNHPREEEPIPA